MTVSLKHTFASAKTDSADATLVQPSNWNAEHQLTLATNRLLGRTTAGTGVAEEISVSAPLSLSGGALAVSTIPVASGGTGATTLTGYVKGNGTSAMTASASVPVGDLSGTLPVASGGTGSTTLAANNVLLGNGTSALQVVAPSTSGNLLTSNGTSWVSQPSANIAKVWTSLTATGTYTVPSGTTSIRVYAFGAGGNGVTAGGGGGGCAFGDVAVTSGDVFSISISSGIATVTRSATTLFTANAGVIGSSGGAGGTATINALVTNGGAYTGGTGGNTLGGGGSSGSPLGTGTGSGSLGGGGGGWGGVGGAGGGFGSSRTGGGGGGTGGSGAAGIFLAGGGGGGSATSATQGTPGSARNTIIQTWTDPLLDSLDCYGPGGVGTSNDSRSGNTAQSGSNGGGGGGVGPAGLNTSVATCFGAPGGSGGGGGGAYAFAGTVTGGKGGFGGGGGGAGYSSSGPATGGAGGYGGGGGGANAGAGGAGGAAIVLIYA